jgi:pimeloyl-ACP methyl ester carboxylesterase
LSRRRRQSRAGEHAQRTCVSPGSTSPSGEPTPRALPAAGPLLARIRRLRHADDVPDEGALGRRLSRARAGSQGRALWRAARTRPAGSTFREAAAWTDATYRDRRDDFTRLIAALHEKDGASWNIDWTHVGIAGHSLGGYTALALAGGWPSWKQPELKAVLALSPYCEPLALHGSLATLDVPVMYQGGTRDIGITPSVGKRGGCYAQTSAPAHFVDLDGAGHFAWTDLVAKHQPLITA